TGNGQGHKLGDTCIAGAGQCKYGTEKCTAGTYGACGTGTSEIGPSAETCNNLDDDCDGYTDNTPGSGSNTLTNTQYDSLCGAAFGTQFCQEGQGQCKYGTQTCKAGGTWQTTTNEVGPTAEQCNGKDDDCDGFVDNAVTGSSTKMSQ